MINFRVSDGRNITVIKSGEHIATIRVLLSGIKLDISVEDERMTIDDLEQILAKMKELQGTNADKGV